MTSSRVRGILWDFDNTLVDTLAKNRTVTRRIVRSVTGRDPDAFPALRSLAAYDAALHRTQNWQQLYREELELAPEEIEAAGGLWTAYQLADTTPTPIFEGVPEVVRALRHLPQAIVSLNTRDNIRETLRAATLHDAFTLIIGCEQVGLHCQKPAPDAVLLCLERLALDGPGGAVLYVGDHPIDAECAANANAVLARRGAELRVIAVRASYGSAASLAAWVVEPDHRVSRPGDILDIVAALPAP
ncbi:MAG: HAD family hydrolase [Gemmatimonadota bacterium]